MHGSGLLHRKHLRTSFLNIVKPPVRKLNCDSEQIRDNYNTVLNKITDRHKIFAKLNGIMQIGESITPAAFQLLLNRWNDELTEHMKASENRCHKFKQNHIDFSPEVGMWIQRRWLIGRIKRYLEGKVPDPRNLI